VILLISSLVCASLLFMVRVYEGSEEGEGIEEGIEEEGTYADSSDTGPATASPPSSKYLKHPSLRIARSAIWSV